MGVIDRAREALHAFTAPKAKSLGSQLGWDSLVTHGFDSFQATFGTGKMVRPFAQHPTVYAAVSAISQGISAIPLEFFPEGDEETPVKDSTVLDLISNPGPDMDGPQLIEGTIDFMELSGDAFWFLDGFARRSAACQRAPLLRRRAMNSAIVSGS